MTHLKNVKARPVSKGKARPSEKKAPATPAPDAAPANEPKSETAPTKTATVLELLQQPEGASLAELVAATGWLPHTTRAALTGLRKKGHTIGKAKVDGATRYTIGGAASA